MYGTDDGPDNFLSADCHTYLYSQVACGNQPKTLVVSIWLYLLTTE